MRPDRPALATLAAVIRHDIAAIERMDNDLCSIARALDREDVEFRDLAAASYLMHNIYNAFENAFEQISRTFENHVVDPSRWHRELQDKMFLDIPTVRPGVFPAGCRSVLNDLRGFRHLFRHSYDFEIEPIRLKFLVERWNTQKNEVLNALRHFSEIILVEVD